MVIMYFQWGKTWKFDFFKSYWALAPQNHRDLNQGILHLWSKFGDPSLNGVSYGADKLKMG